MKLRKNFAQHARAISNRIAVGGKLCWHSAPMRTKDIKAGFNRAKFRIDTVKMHSRARAVERRLRRNLPPLNVNEIKGALAYMHHNGRFNVSEEALLFLDDIHFFEHIKHSLEGKNPYHTGSKRQVSKIIGDAIDSTCHVRELFMNRLARKEVKEEIMGFMAHEAKRNKYQYNEMWAAAFNKFIAPSLDNPSSKDFDEADYC